MKKLASLAVVAVAALAIVALAGAAEKYTVSATLKNNTEVPRAKGAPLAKGSFSGTYVENKSGATLTWKLSYQHLTGKALAAHIHKGKRQENGPIVVPLSQPATGDPGASSGCTMAAADLAQDIQRHPKRYYVNVHTADFPNGAARGQLGGKKR